jgi:hypothetical protein
MLSWLESLVARLRWTARRWLPGLFVRVTRKDVAGAQSALARLTEEEIEEGHDSVKRAIQVAREREVSPPPGSNPS